MRRDTVFLQEWFLCKMELQWVIRAQADVQTRLEEVRERVPLIRQEQGVVAEWAHRDTNLLQVEQVLQRRDLPQGNAVRDGV